MDTNQVIENSEEAVETAAEAIAEAGWTGSDVAAGFGAGVLAGVLLAKLVIAPLWGKAKAKWASRPPKEIQVGGKTETTAEETETKPVEESTEK